MGDYLFVKVGNETRSAISIIDSCKTVEQLDNANNWACSLVDKWYYLMDKNFGLWNNVDIHLYIDSAASDLTKEIYKIRRKINSKNV